MLGSWIKCKDGSLRSTERTIHFCFDRKTCSCGQYLNSFVITPLADGSNRFSLRVTIPGPQPFDEVLDQTFASVGSAKAWVTKNFT